MIVLFALHRNFFASHKDEDFACVWCCSETLVKHGFSYSGKDIIYSGVQFNLCDNVLNIFSWCKLSNTFHADFAAYCWFLYTITYGRSVMTIQA